MAVPWTAGTASATVAASAADAVAAGAGLAVFGILGPLEVRRSGQAVPLGGPRQRAVLALLLLEANRVVSMDRLAEDVWAGDPPEGWTTTLQTYVFHLRQALEPGRSRGAAGGVLVTSGRGYLLRVDRAGVRDVSRFPGRDHFAAYNGTAPIEVSSGKRKIYRLSRRGNRRLNHAIHMAAVTQVSHRHSAGRAYYDRKRAEARHPKKPCAV